MQRGKKTNNIQLRSVFHGNMDELIKVIITSNMSGTEQHVVWYSRHRPTGGRFTEQILRGQKLKWGHVTCIGL